MFSIIPHRLFKFKPICINMVQCSSNVNSFTNFPEISFSPKFSQAEQEKILNILNGSSSTQLSGLNVAKSRIKRLESYKRRKGPFKSLDQLLDVDGVSVKMLEKLCKQLIYESPSRNGKSSNNANKKIKQFLTPPLPANYSVQSAVGIHLAPMGVSWAKIIGEKNALQCWGYQDYEDLPKKMCPTETFQLAMNLLRQIPSGDVYIFEGTNGMGLQKQAVIAYNLHSELSSMLLALINTSKDHNKDYQNDPTDYQPLTNRVYFLKSKLPARLFKTLVGNECVSNTATVLQLIDNSHVTNVTLPCSPIVIDHELKNNYLAQSSVHKELLGQALMLTVAFSDVCVKKKTDSIKILIPGKR